MTNDESVHAESIVIDAVSPLTKDHPQYLDWYREGGVTVVAPTIATVEPARVVLDRLGKWHRWLRERDDLLLVKRALDVETAKKTNRLGIYFHFQGTDAVEDNLDLIDVYKSLGVGMIQLTYNRENAVGYGCEVRSDGGLSSFGRQLVRRLNEAGVIVDCSHTGERTSLDAIEASFAPVVLSHANAQSVHLSYRNASPILLDAVQQSGGVVGVVGFPAMIGLNPRPNVDMLIEHIDAIVQRIGIDHVGLGLDYFLGQAGVMSDEDALRDYNDRIARGVWGAAYPPPPYHYPREVETPRTLPRLTDRLISRGYTDLDVQKILGENWHRVMRVVWG